MRHRLALALLVAWAGGFCWFAVDALRPSPPPPDADGIAVLTGDADRVETGLDLLAQGRARQLLISGAGPRLSLATIARRAGRDPASLDDRVTLGREAVSTWGNGGEFAQWAQDHQIHRALVVTSFYHMRRSLMELRRAAPGVDLIAVKVPATPRLTARSGRLLLEDYTKYLLALIGLSRFSPGHRAA